MTKPLPCPFCGAEPDFPVAEDVFGTWYEAGCNECGIATISFQIIDHFDLDERGALNESWDNDRLQYGVEFINKVRDEMIAAWNQRAMWQPIDTAPKDGTMLLLAKFDTEVDEPVMWWSAKGHWSERWNCWYDGLEPSGLANPNFWMPIVAPMTKEN